MSHFYGKLQGARGEATRCGNKGTGLDVTAAAWGGCVETRLWHDEATGVDMAEVSLSRWHGRGTSRVLYRGPINPDEDQKILDEAQAKKDLNPSDETEAAKAAARARTARAPGMAIIPELDEPDTAEAARERSSALIEQVKAEQAECVERLVCRKQAAHEHAEIWKQERAKNRAAMSERDRLQLERDEATTARSIETERGEA